MSQHCYTEEDGLGLLFLLIYCQLSIWIVLNTKYKMNLIHPPVMIISSILGRLFTAQGKRRENWINSRKCSSTHMHTPQTTPRPRTHKCPTVPRNAQSSFEGYKCKSTSCHRNRLRTLQKWLQSKESGSCICILLC